MTSAALLLLIASATGIDQGCPITGSAVLWAYDLCLWRHETDDTLHPGVHACVGEAEQLIKKIGPCPAKLKFKEQICQLAVEWKTGEADFASCVAEDRPKGPSVINGGIE